MKATRAPLLATLAASLALLLVACAPNAPRVAAPTASVIEAAPLPAPEPASEPAPPAASAADADPPWSRLRQQFQMQRCDYRPQVQHWLRAFVLMGLVERTDNGWRKLRDPEESEFALTRQQADPPYASSARVLEALEAQALAS